jgi:hypothetical protein
MAARIFAHAQAARLQPLAARALIQAAEKVIYFVILSEARNLSWV